MRTSIKQPLKTWKVTYSSGGVRTFRQPDYAAAKSHAEMWLKKGCEIVGIQLMETAEQKESAKKLAMSHFENSRLGEEAQEVETEVAATPSPLAEQGKFLASLKMVGQTFFSAYYGPLGSPFHKLGDLSVEDLLTLPGLKARGFLALLSWTW